MILSSYVKIFLEGFLFNLGLIISIGPQNAYLLRAGALRNYTALVATIYILGDVLAIFLGVLCISGQLDGNPMIMRLTQWCGILFLLAIAAYSFYNVFRTSASHDGLSRKRYSLKGTILICLGTMVLNPNMVLDTFLLASYSSVLDQVMRYAYFFGAVFASVFWFIMLAWGAILLAPRFATPRGQKVLDFIVGCIMALMAFLIFKRL